MDLLSSHLILVPSDMIILPVSSLVIVPFPKQHCVIPHNPPPLGPPGVLPVPGSSFRASNDRLTLLALTSLVSYLSALIELLGSLFRHCLLFDFPFCVSSASFCREVVIITLSLRGLARGYRIVCSLFLLFQIVSVKPLGVQNIFGGINNLFDTEWLPDVMLRGDLHDSELKDVLDWLCHPPTLMNFLWDDAKDSEGPSLGIIDSRLHSRIVLVCLPSTGANHLLGN
ncbi:hypothetical protein JAAARDRAFT_200889 [Jaapia argillacea MUCL 33604]|uniref:Uncharacterized protein n=1 Tax=Jaapia argillacea MUCL 33604 TaxID=933084 RepID=A0A067PEH8_9AGAM|nr:hypothetical protein JAAARDRAFT_200889 [Jaapia argillacea MUCL 33604]